MPINFITLCDQIFSNVIAEYHLQDNVDAVPTQSDNTTSIESYLYRKCWIDTVQWHLEDIIRNPSINPVEALAIKRRIDASNQQRTDLVEEIDRYFLQLFKNATLSNSATINTESPAWAVDRLSILYLKIYHMQREVERTDASKEHIAQCSRKLEILLAQKEDLTKAIHTLLLDYQAGRKYMKTYVQMKMYNDPNLNPVLYKK